MISSATTNRRTHATLRKPRRPSSGSRRTTRLPLEAALLLLAMIAAALGAGTWVHPAWSLVAIGNYIWLCTLFFRIEPRSAILALPFLINSASSMVALVMIEYGAEMFELGLVGRPGPWSNELNFYNLLFFAGIIIAAHPFLRALDSRTSPSIPLVLDRFAVLLAGIVLTLVTLITLALIVRGLQLGFPLLAGTDRFAFRRFSADKVTLYALNLKFVLAYALGFVTFILPTNRYIRKLAILSFTALMAVYFLFGDKFFTQLGALSAFSAPYLYNNYSSVRRRLWTYVVAAALALTGVMLVTTYIYSKGFTETSAATTKRLSGRIVGQGELWFLQSSIGAAPLSWNSTAIARYGSSLGIKNVDLYAVQNSLGAHYFSNRYAPDYLRASLHKNAGSVTYTAVTEAMGLALFGWIGLGVMMLALGGLLGLACAYIGYAIENRSILSGFFAAYIYNQLRNSIVQATPWVIGSIYSLRWLALILIIELGLLVLVRGSSQSGFRHGRNTARFARSIKPAPEPAV